MSVWTLSALTESLKEYKTEICLIAVEGSKPFTSQLGHRFFAYLEKIIFNAQVNGVFTQRRVKAVRHGELPGAQTSALCLSISDEHSWTPYLVSWA